MSTTLGVKIDDKIEQERREDEARWERYVLTGEAVSHERARTWLSPVRRKKRSRR